MKKPKIAILASNLYPIPPLRTAAAELIVSQITEGLVQRGFPVTLYAAGDTKTTARLIAATPRASIREPKIGMENHKAYELIQTSNAYRDATRWGAKILLSHVPMMSAHFSPFAPFPSTALLHSPPTETDQAVMRTYKKWQSYVAISKAQRALVPGVRFIQTIQHGVDLAKLPFHPKPGSYLAFLGRIRNYKGVHEAITVAHRLNLPLRIAGPIGDPLYYAQQVKPYLNSRIRYVGEITHREKGTFLGNALATLFPISWDEPFGLVLIESLAVGTPVVAFKRGSVPEILKDGKTGFIVKNTSAMVQAVRHIDTIDRATCRKDMEKRFRLDRMVDDYAALLTHLAK